MKLGSVTKLDKTTSKTKQCQENFTMMLCQQIVTIFPIYGQFGAIRKPDTGCIVCKIYIFINSNLLSYKN